MSASHQKSGKADCQRQADMPVNDRISSSSDSGWCISFLLLIYMFQITELSAGITRTDDSELGNQSDASERRVRAVPIEAQSAVIWGHLASICNDERGRPGVTSGRG